jgi:hypothetical protein
MELIPDYGDHMTLEVFINACKSGGFIDYDGYGQYATETKMSNEIVCPSDIESGNINEKYTHVVWFNR